MTFEQIKDHLNGLPVVYALWWFIENMNEESAHRSETFFYLRERFHGMDSKDEFKFTKDLEEAQRCLAQL